MSDLEINQKASAKGHTRKLMAKIHPESAHYPAQKSEELSDL